LEWAVSQLQAFFTAIVEEAGLNLCAAALCNFFFPQLDRIL
jgi:hypothetical protein